jgi:AcrR family transcriptional regulator
MRISKKAKAENLEIILATATQLFTAKGYEVTTTREIAAGAGLAPSSMFNYFDTKEALALRLLAETLELGRKSYLSRRTGKEDLAEDLFLLITSELRQLKPYRNFAGPVFEKTMGLFPKAFSCPEGERVKDEHLQIVQKIINRHGGSSIPTLLSSSLYLSLYLGILAFWSRDESRNQEETLALIDYSLKLFSQTILKSLNP